MELLDIISTIHNLTQKPSEYNEEVQNLSFTVMTLGKAIQNIEKLKESNSVKDWEIFEDYLKSLL